MFEIFYENDHPEGRVKTKQDNDIRRKKSRGASAESGLLRKKRLWRGDY
jgi:hypothetical protein